MEAEVSIVPLGRGWRLGDDISKLVDIIDKSGLDYHLGPMGTTIAGDYDQVMEVIKKCHLKMKETSKRVLTIIKIDDDAEYPANIEHRIKSVEKRLGRKLKK